MPIKKPDWLKIKPFRIGSKEMNDFLMLRSLSERENINTVCKEAHCPNMWKCWANKTASFMILGNVCTRSCKFCNIKTGYPNGKIDKNEGEKLALIIKKLGLKYVVITSVDRDDLPDFGANHFVDCVKTIKEMNPELVLELLIPDFMGNIDCLKKIAFSSAEVIGHNLETVRRLTPSVRDLRANYDQSLFVLAQLKKINPKIYTKSSFLLGIGEKKNEVKKSLQDLRSINVDFVTLGQYLQPSSKHLALKKYVSPRTFKYYENIALEMGFLYAFSGPFVRTSYLAADYFFNSKKENHANFV